jgi:hypothetical protein
MSTAKKQPEHSTTEAFQHQIKGDFSVFFFFFFGGGEVGLFKVKTASRQQEAEAEAASGVGGARAR